MELALEREATLPILEAVGSSDDLVRQAKSDSEALAKLYRMYQPRISAYVLRRSSCQHEAEDIVSDVFIGMVKGIGKYKVGRAPFVTWLYRIATNEIARHARKRRIRTFFSLSQLEHETMPEPLDEDEAVHNALKKLPAKYQDVIALHYVEQLSVEDVAATLRCATGTVKSRLSRGREKMRRLLEVDNHVS